MPQPDEREIVERQQQDSLGAPDLTTRLMRAEAQIKYLTEEREGLKAKLRGLPPTVAAGLIQRLQDQNAALTFAHERARMLSAKWREKDTWEMPIYGICADELDALTSPEGSQQL